jgi:methylglyoxal synthase
MKIIDRLKGIKKGRRTIALIAHDGKKAEMVAFVKDNLPFMRKFNIVATGTTGKYIEQAGLKVTRMERGPHGGDAQIAAMLVEKRLNGVIFLRDPLGVHPHEPDISMLLRLADVHDVPLATNLASAKILIKGLTSE